MDNRKHIHHSSRHFGFSYPTSFWQRFYSISVPLLFVIIVFVVLKLFSVFPFMPTPKISSATIGAAIFATFIRLVIAYALALIISIPLALAVVKNAFLERLLLPLFDIVQSIPVLAFFPIIIIFFMRLGFADGAAVFIIFLSMLWNIVFSLVGGLKVIPNDIKSAAYVFGIKGAAFMKRVLLPAVVPYLVTGSLLAWAQGWNIIIVAEVLHTYIPGGAASQDLFGIGSMLVSAASSGQNGIFVFAILAMIIIIALMNFFIWQKLLHYAERFKFE
jgi:NitT/TauT family transport system permease protein